MTGTTRKIAARIKDLETKKKKTMTTQVMHLGANELEVQRRDICAQHASQAQQ